MDYVTRQFINLTKKLRKELRLALQSLDKRLAEQNTAIREATDASKQSQHSPQVLRAEFKVPPSERYQQESKAARQSIAEYVRLWLEIVGFLVVIAYTTVTAFQLGQMIRSTRATENAAEAARDAADTARETLKASERQFRQENRPYIWAILRSDNPQHVMTVQTAPDMYETAVAVEITNSGHTPATQVLPTTSRVLIGPLQSTLKKACSKLLEYPDKAGGLLSANQPATVPTEKATAFSGAQLKMVVNDEWGIFIIGGVRYEDIFAPKLVRPYQTRYCFTLRAKGMSVADCSCGEVME